MATEQPIARPAEPAAVQQAPEATLASPPEDRARVLVVDDDERNLLAIENVLEDLAEVVTATSGEEALRHLLRGDEFAVILLDVYMPGIDGYETAGIIRGRDQTKRIPIVFLSAVNKETEHLMRGSSMGAVDYVFKPVEPIVLRSKVAVFVDLFSKTREIERKAKAEQELLDANLRANAERLRVEQELRLAEQRQAAIIQSLPIILYLEPLDCTPRCPAFVSGDLQAMTGYSYDTVLANPDIWAERLHEEDRERVLAALEMRRETGTLSVEYRWLCADGSCKHFHDQSVLLKDSDGRPVEFAGTLTDITDRRELENQLLQARKMDAIGKLTGGIAHDFNNLLAAVLGGIGMIERRVALSDDHKKIIGMTRHAAEQGSELVGRLLAFARRQQLEPAPIEINKLSAAVGDLLTHTLGGLVKLDWKKNKDVWPAFADEAQLELALMNLIINARDAMPEGGTITVTGENRSLAADNPLALPQGDYVVLTVADTGSGIPPEIVEKVLEPFFTTKEIGKGTGLGLSMVYGFAKQSDGAIQIGSKLGEGTNVELWLPRAPASSAAAGEDESEADIVPQQDGFPSLSILLADDHHGVRATTAAMLQDLGHEVTEAAGGAEVLDIMKKSPGAHHMIITDYAMPSISGVEVIRRARDMTSDLPGIIITGYADTDSIANRPGDVLVLAKPFTSDQLNKAVRAAYARRANAQPEAPLAATA